MSCLCCTIKLKLPAVLNSTTYLTLGLLYTRTLKYIYFIYFTLKYYSSSSDKVNSKFIQISNIMIQ